VRLPQDKVTAVLLSVAILLIVMIRVSGVILANDIYSNFPTVEEREHISFEGYVAAGVAVDP
jgi:hypothetical protein